MPQDGIQIALHTRLLLRSQFQIRQLGNPTHILDSDTNANLFSHRLNYLFISKCISLTLTSAILAISPASCSRMLMNCCNHVLFTTRTRNTPLS